MTLSPATKHNLAMPLVLSSPVSLMTYSKHQLLQCHSPNLLFYESTSPCRSYSARLNRLHLQFCCGLQVGATTCIDVHPLNLYQSDSSFHPVSWRQVAPQERGCCQCLPVALIYKYLPHCMRLSYHGIAPLFNCLQQITQRSFFIVSPVPIHACDFIL